MLVQLQYIRAFAALLVVYFHATLQLAILDPEATLSHLVFGESGVDLFFVLSGFVMWVTTDGKTISPLAFYGKRIRRIVPLYWSATLAAALIAFAMPSLLRSTVFDLQHLAASLMFIPWINPADPQGLAVTPVIVPGWTLNYEMFFYLLFGLVLLLPRSLRLPALIAAFVAVVAACALSPWQSITTRFYGDWVIFEFLAGAIIGRYYKAGLRLPSVMAWLALGLGSVSIIGLDFLELDAGRLLTMGIPAIFIVAGAVSIDFSRMPSLPWLRYLGDASYSLYLTHIFVLPAIRMVYQRAPDSIIGNEFVFIAVALVASIVVAVGVHALFEAPIDRFLNRRKAATGADGRSANLPAAAAE